jgi:3-isopropylmalate dehydrogenase
MPQSATIAVVDGEGIGPSIIDAALEVLSSALDATGRRVDVRRLPALTERDEYGLTLGPVAADFYRDVFDNEIPILHGPAGGRFVYELRHQFALSVKHTPIAPWTELANVAIVDPSRMARADMLIVRDNSGGLYQGAFTEGSDSVGASHSATYTVSQVETILASAIAAASERNQHLSVVIKPGGVPTISRLWRATAERLVPDSIELDFVEIDNACFQVLADPDRFDVIATPNMFGDVLGDTATALLGSRGMAYSANFGVDGRAVYQTAHGAAHDLAGRDLANPIAQILSLAWLLRESLGMAEEADIIVAAVRHEVTAGVRTPDIGAEGSMIVGTRRFAGRVSEQIAAGRVG